MKKTRERGPKLFIVHKRMKERLKKREAHIFLKIEVFAPVFTCCFTPVNFRPVISSRFLSPSQGYNGWGEKCHRTPSLATRDVPLHLDWGSRCFLTFPCMLVYSKNKEQI